MPENNNNITLYHASYTVIEHIDLEKCRKQNDFGQGFYVTTDKQQAVRFVKTAVKKSGKDLANGFVNTYNFTNTAGLNVFEFSSVDKEWLHCVCAHRRLDILESELEKWRHYDIVSGRIANDDTMTVITVYIAGGYGEYGSASAMDMAIGLLKPERLKDQLCFKTKKAIQRLQCIGSFEVAIS
jgi:hypothetical protein